MGGKDAEKEERQKWDNAEHKKIMDSVNSLLERRNRYIAEHQQPNSAQDNVDASETVELVDSNIFENEDEKNLSSEDVNLEANESKEEKLNHIKELNFEYMICAVCAKNGFLNIIKWFRSSLKDKIFFQMNVIYKC